MAILFNISYIIIIIRLYDIVFKWILYSVLIKSELGMGSSGRFVRIFVCCMCLLSTSVSPRLASADSHYFINTPIENLIFFAF